MNEPDHLADFKHALLCRFGTNKMDEIIASLPQDSQAKIKQEFAPKPTKRVVKIIRKRTKPSGP